MKIVCQNDGVVFEAKRATAKFCSDKCRKAFARIRGIDLATGEVKTPAPIKAPIRTQVPQDTPEASSGVDYTTIENPFDRIADEEYDAEAALKAFQKMGLEQVQWISTGIPAFDALTQIPKGRLTQIEGRYSVGKTTLCLNMVLGLRDKKVLYIDSEASLNPELLVALKLDTNNFELYNKSAYLEDISEILRKAIKSKVYDLIVLDSLAMTTTRTIEESDITASNIGQKPKIFNKTLELIMGDLRDSKTALVIINQTRDKIGTYVPETYTPGGTGKDYNASLMISLKTIKSWRFGRTAADTKKKIFIGQEVEATIIKSKVNTPWRTAKFKLYYPQAIDKSSEEAEIEPQF